MRQGVITGSNGGHRHYGRSLPALVCRADVGIDLCRFFNRRRRPAQNLKSITYFGWTLSACYYQTPYTRLFAWQTSPLYYSVYDLLNAILLDCAILMIFGSTMVIYLVDYKMPVRQKYLRYKNGNETLLFPQTVGSCC